MNSSPVAAAQVTIMHDLMKLSRIINVKNVSRKITIAAIMKTAKDVKSTGQNLPIRYNNKRMGIADKTATVSSKAVAATKTLIKKIIRNSITTISKIMLNGFVLLISGVMRNSISAITPKTPNANET